MKDWMKAGFAVGGAVLYALFVHPSVQKLISGKTVGN